MKEISDMFFIKEPVGKLHAVISKTNPNIAEFIDDNGDCFGWGNLNSILKVDLNKSENKKEI